MKVNCNNMVSFTLTDAGAKLWNSRYDRTTLPKHRWPSSVFAGAVVRTQLWDLMHVFGPAMQMGMDACFEGMSLDITPDVQEQFDAGLRDEFAMAALPKLIREGDKYKDIAVMAYMMADAMLEARNANR